MRNPDFFCQGGRPASENASPRIAVAATACKIESGRSDFQVGPGAAGVHFGCVRVSQIEQHLFHSRARAAARASVFVCARDRKKERKKERERAYKSSEKFGIISSDRGC